MVSVVNKYDRLRAVILGVVAQGPFVVVRVLAYQVKCVERRQHFLAAAADW